MKNGKVARKIKRLELLNILIEKLENVIDSINSSLEYYEDKLRELNKEDKDEYNIQCYQENIEEYTIELDEAKKLLAELEKMI